MLELTNLSNNCSYISGPTNVGFINLNNNIYIVDSGNDKDYGRRIRQLLDSMNLKLKGILCTHAHADHIGGNHYLEKQYDLKIYANAIEDSIIKNTILNPNLIYGGCPGNELLNKIFYAQPSNNVFNFDDEDFPSSVQLISLPGHSQNMTGFLVDGVAYIGDSLFGKENLQKYPIPYIYNPGQYLESLDIVNALECDYFVPSHSIATKNIKELVEINKACVYDIFDSIKKYTNEYITYEDLVAKLFIHYNINQTKLQIILVGSTIRSFLSYMQNENMLISEVINGKIHFKYNIL